MAALLESYPWIRSLWTLWFFVLFVGIIAWVMWPSRRRHWRQAGDIPFQDDGRSRLRSKRN